MGAFGYERPPLVTSGDISARGFSTLGRTSPAFDIMQGASQAAGVVPVNMATGPVLLGGPGLALGIVVLLAFAYYLDRRVL